METIDRSKDALNNGNSPFLNLSTRNIGRLFRTCVLSMSRNLFAQYIDTLSVCLEYRSKNNGKWHEKINSASLMSLNDHTDRIWMTFIYTFFYDPNLVTNARYRHTLCCIGNNILARSGLLILFCSLKVCFHGSTITITMPNSKFIGNCSVIFPSSPQKYSQLKLYRQTFFPQI